MKKKKKKNQCLFKITMSRRVLGSGVDVLKQWRLFSTTQRASNLFGGQKMLNRPSFQPPSGKGESTPNPVDMIKRNDILMLSQKPTNYIESVKDDGFYLANSLLISSPDKDGNIIGALMLEKQTYEINFNVPTAGIKVINGFIINISDDVLQIFEKVHPKPEICVVGLGKKSRILSESNRKFFSNLGIQLEFSDSNNAAQSFDMLATERPDVVAALLLPPNV